MEAPQPRLGERAEREAWLACCEGKATNEEWRALGDTVGE